MIPLVDFLSLACNLIASLYITFVTIRTLSLLQMRTFLITVTLHLTIVTHNYGFLINYVSYLTLSYNYLFYFNFIPQLQVPSVR